MQIHSPNILLITSDQLRWDYVGCYGKAPWIQTPHIDRLAEEGCLFERAYSPNPVCIPARHNLITGLTARHHGFDDNYFGPNAKALPHDLPTFAEILSDKGYATAAIGKMHFQPERRATGFDMFLNMDEVVKDMAEDEYAQYLRDQGYGEIGSIHGVRNILYMQPQQSIIPEEHHGSKWVADRSMEYLRERAARKDRPFLLWAGFIAPHPPLDVPEAWAHLYDGKVPHHTSHRTPLPQIAVENTYNAFFQSEETLNRWRELYASSITFMDHQIGRILDALDAYGLSDNTMVVFVSDHGEMLGDNDTYQKMLAYEASMHIPFVIRYPGKIQPGTRRSDFVDLNDLLPTFLAEADATYPASFELPGESLFASQPRKDRTIQYGEYQHGSKRWCTLIEGHYKYIHYYGDEDELFDLKNDPDESTNLLHGNPREEILSLRNTLKKRLLTEERKWGLPGHIEDGDFKSFPPYKAIPRRERIFPHSAVKGPDDPAYRPIEEDIFQAIEKEDSVHIGTLEAGEVLLNQGHFSEERFQAFLQRAKEKERF